MFAGLATKLAPYMLYLIYIQLLLVGMAVLAGAFLLIKRVLSKEPLEGDPAYTNEKIAYELTTEINRLRDLRNRIFPKLAEAEAAGGTVVVQAPAPALNAEALAKLEKDVEQKVQEQFKGKLEELETKNKELEQKVLAGGTAPAAGADGQGSLDALAQFSKEKGELETERKELKDKVEVLERTLSEYQIFENDIALVKKYKVENEELRKQLTSSPQVTEDDIANLFTAMDGEKAAAPAPMEPLFPETPAPAAAPVAVVDAAPAPVPTPQAEPVAVAEVAAPISVAALEAEAASVASAAEAMTAQVAETPAPAPSAANDEIEALLNAAQAEIDAAKSASPAPVPGEPPAKGFVAEKVDEPTLSPNTVTPEDLEALAESGTADDKLMAEFQKVLGENKS